MALTRSRLPFVETKEPSGEEDPWSRPSGEEPEPDWAEQIRSRRRARADSLKDVFASFASDAALDDEEPWK